MAATRGDGLLHPIALGAVALLLLNDHVLKAAAPGWVTGKLSDVAGLAFFPLFLQALWELLGPRRGAFQPSRRVLVAACWATALVFAGVKTWPPMAALYREGLGWLQLPLRVLVAVAQGRSPPGHQSVRLILDTTDLLALPAVGLALWAGGRRALRQGATQMGSTTRS